MLEMLRAQGLFEPPAGESAQWAPRAEVKKTQASGTRIGIWLGAAWLLAIGLAVGGWYGWQWWTERRHAQAAELVARAREQAFRGTHADLVDAERLLREARELHPTDLEGPKLLLFVHAQRALEDGAFEAGYLRPSIARAEQLEADSAYLDVARAVLAAAEGGQEQARARLASALEARGSDAAILYVAGRLEQRLGGETALDHLQAAIEADGDLVAPRIALAEVRHDEGQAEEALALLDAVLADAAEHLRAVLWRAFLTSDGEDPAAALAAIARLEEDIDEHGAPTDHVLFELTRARLLRRRGQTAEAGAAVDEALLAGASEPRLLALVATEGRRAGRLLRAEQAARAAVAGAPRNADFQEAPRGHPARAAQRPGRAHDAGRPRRRRSGRAGDARARRAARRNARGARGRGGGARRGDRGEPGGQRRAARAAHPYARAARRRRWGSARAGAGALGGRSRGSRRRARARRGGAPRARRPHRGGRALAGRARGPRRLGSALPPRPCQAPRRRRRRRRAGAAARGRAHPGAHRGAARARRAPPRSGRLRGGGHALHLAVELGPLVGRARGHRGGAASGASRR
ncbi:MAG: hypothetical protein M5U28_17345 [Sandaracinaceae bacterium]|nr:hypothetical protein [Sandaracinaceae bacterium]